jgi:hypothetical protein
VQRADQFHEQMRTGGNGYDFGIGLAGAIRVREKPALGGTPASKDEHTTDREQGASLIDVFHERILALVCGRKSADCDTIASATLSSILPGAGRMRPTSLRGTSLQDGLKGSRHSLRNFKDGNL